MARRLTEKQKRLVHQLAIDLYDNELAAIQQGVQEDREVTAFLLESARRKEEKLGITDGRLAAQVIPIDFNSDDERYMRLARLKLAEDRRDAVKAWYMQALKGKGEGECAWKYGEKIQPVLAKHELLTVTFDDGSPLCVLYVASLRGKPFGVAIAENVNGLPYCPLLTSDSVYDPRLLGDSLREELEIPKSWREDDAFRFSAGKYNKALADAHRGRGSNIPVYITFGTRGSGRSYAVQFPLHQKWSLSLLAPALFQMRRRTSTVRLSEIKAQIEAQNQ